MDEPLCYWSSDREAEIDFLIPFNNHLVPIEIKSDKGKNTKSLKIYSEKFTPPFLVRSSLRNFQKEAKFINIPLYAISHLPTLLEEQKKQETYLV